MVLTFCWYSILSSTKVGTHDMFKKCWALTLIGHYNNILTVLMWYFGDIREIVLYMYKILNSRLKYSFVGEQHGLERGRSWCHWGRICDSICSIYYHFKLSIFNWVELEVRIFNWLLIIMYNRTLSLQSNIRLPIKIFGFYKTNNLKTPCLTWNNEIIT